MAASHSTTNEGGDGVPSEQTSTAVAGNQFANDGSFMEMFRKRMEEQKKAKMAASPEPKTSDERSSPTTTGPVDEALGTAKDSVTGGASTAKPYQGFAGKRKALLKSAELREKRKKRREEREDQRAVEAEEGKSNAWKAYMAEVKAYESRNCSDSDGHKRPLVK